MKTGFDMREASMTAPYSHAIRITGMSRISASVLTLIVPAVPLYADKDAKSG